MEGPWLPSDRRFKQRLFSKDELHYLNATRIGILTLFNPLDCLFACVRNTLCLSVNMAAPKEGDGKLWCELLSSDKYKDAENYNENMSSHHFSTLVRTSTK